MGLLDKAAEKKSEPKVVEVEKPKRQRRSRKKEVEVEPAEAETNVGLPLRDNAVPLASVSVSETIKLVNDTFPVFDIVIE